MNTIVRAWKRSHIKSLYKRTSEPDSLTIDDEPITLVNKPSKSGDKHMSHESRKVSVNKAAVQELVVQGPQTRVTMLLTETTKAVTRLGLRVGRAKPFTSARNGGGRPSVHDIMRWLEDLRRPTGNEDALVASALNEDLEFLRRVHATLVHRNNSVTVER